MKQFISFLLSALLIGISGCASGGPVVNSSPFKQNVCKAPCWQGLTPGQSTSADVSHSIDVLSKSGWRVKKVLDYPGCKWTRLEEDSSVLSDVDFYVENDQLIFIKLWSPGETTLEEIVSHFGTPEYFEALSANGDAGILYDILVYYPKQGLAFEVLSHNESDVGKINSDMEVFTVQYYQPGNLLAYFTHEYSCFFGEDAAIARGKTEIANNVQPWSGFGTVKVIQTH